MMTPAQLENLKQAEALLKEVEALMVIPILSTATSFNRNKLTEVSMHAALARVAVLELLLAEQPKIGGN